MLQEFADRYQNKYYGKYRGEVASIDDPRKLYRVKVRVPVVFGQDDNGDVPISGWAWPSFGGGNVNKGSMFSVAVGDNVWVEFEQGDIERPIYTPGVWSLLGGENNLPTHARQAYDNSDNVMRDMEGIPSSRLNSGYGQVHGILTPGGHRLELDDTEGSERVVLEHKAGTRIEILTDGTCHVITNGNKRVITTGSLVEDVSGEHTPTYRGNSIKTVKKTQSERTEGDFERIVIGEATYTFANLQTTAESETRLITGPSKVTVNAHADRVYGGPVTDSIFGSYQSTVVNTAKWLIANATGVTPGNAAEIKVLSALFGDIELASGPDPTGLALSNSIKIRHPVGKVPGVGIPGASDIILKAVASMALGAPFIMLGPTESAVGLEPTVKGFSLLTWLNTHSHGSSAGPTTPPLIPAATNILSAGGAPSVGTWVF